VAVAVDTCIPHMTHNVLTYCRALLLLFAMSIQVLVLKSFGRNQEEELQAAGGALLNFCLAGVGLRVVNHGRARGARGTAQ